MQPPEPDKQQMQRKVEHLQIHQRMQARHQQALKRRQALQQFLDKQAQQPQQ
jgi:hypothetical protein